MKSKITILCLYLFSIVSVYANEDMQQVFKKHRKELHQEQKKWAEMEDECKSKYPQWYDTKSPDYDKGFECKEKIQDLKLEFRENHRAEICEKFNVCKK